MITITPNRAKGPGIASPVRSAAFCRRCSARVGTAAGAFGPSPKCRLPEDRTSLPNGTFARTAIGRRPEGWRCQPLQEKVSAMRKKVLVLGGNFGGLTAALSVKHALNGDKARSGYVRLP